MTLTVIALVSSGLSIAISAYTFRLQRAVALINAATGRPPETWTTAERRAMTRISR